jgi:hypothetical protein
MLSSSFYKQGLRIACGGKCSLSDYKKLTNKDQWHRWQRNLMGTAFEHKCENVLDPSYVPNPLDTDECELFDLQQHWMYSVFTKVLIEGHASDILCNYSKSGSQNFGDAQQVYSDLLDHFEDGNMACVSAQALEQQLTLMHLNCSWTKSVTAFVNKVAHVIRDHKEQAIR